MMTPVKQKEFISKKYNFFYPAPEVTRAEREVIMYITTRFFFPHGIEGEAMDNTVLEWESLGKAIAYCHRYDKGLRFAGVQVEDKNGKLIYELTDNGVVTDNRLNLL